MSAHDFKSLTRVEYSALLNALNGTQDNDDGEVI